MGKLVEFYHSFYLTRLFYIVGAAIVILFAISFFYDPLFSISELFLYCLTVLVFIDMALLYLKKKAMLAGRSTKNRFNNGLDNEIIVAIQNNYSFKVGIAILEELPFQFGVVDNPFKTSIQNGQLYQYSYNLKPLKRGEYFFGKTLCFVQSPIKLVERRFKFNTEQTVYVYPAYSLLKQYSLQAISSQLQQTGIKKTRKIGNTQEFEQIKEYVRGDDFRTINWKSTARKNDLMVNTYTDEKSQQVYCIIDKSRNMRMPFEGMTLLDYSINASLVLANVAIQKQDRAGLICFAEKLDTFLPADKDALQMQLVLESLYKQETQFFDANYENLYSTVRSKIKQRSLLVLFTNFESKYSLERQLPFLRKLSHYHLLMVVFFENSEIKKIHAETVKNTEDIYVQTIADKFLHEKRLLIKELQKYGITAVLTTPKQLTINAINKYLEIKNRQAL